MTTRSSLRAATTAGVASLAAVGGYALAATIQNATGRSLPGAAREFGTVFRRASAARETELRDALAHLDGASPTSGAARDILHDPIRDRAHGGIAHERAR